MELIMIIVFSTIFVFACMQLVWGVIKFTWKHAILLTAILILIIFLLDF